MPNVKIKPTIVAAAAVAGDVAAAATRVGEILMEAFIVKALTSTGTLKLPSGDGDGGGDGVIILSERLVCRVLSRRSVNISRKMDFFRWCSSCKDNPNFRHTVATYSAVFAAVCRSRRLRELPSLIASMKSDGVVASAAVSKLLLRSLISSGDFVSAVDILNQVEDAAGGRLSLDAYSSAVLDLSSKNQLATAVAVFSRLLDSIPRGGAFTPRAAVASTKLLISLKREKKKSEFEHVFSLIREGEFVMDTWGYNICVHAFACWGDMKTALNLFDEMKEKKFRSLHRGPDLCTYNSLIHGLCRLGKIEDAISLKKELRSSAYDPDEFTYFTLIHGCIRSCRIEGAVRLFDKMLMCGFYPDIMVYNSLIDGLFKARRVEDACVVFEQMTASGIPPSCCTHNILIDGLIRNGRAAAGYELFCELKNVRGGRLIDNITYSIVVLQLCRECLLDDALMMVTDMTNRGFALDLVTVTSILAEFHRQRRWDWAERLMKHVADGALVRNVSEWESNMKIFTRNVHDNDDHTPMFPHRGKAHEVLSLLGAPPVSLRRGRRVREENNSSFDIDMVNTYMSIFLSNGKLSLACKLLEVFTSIGVRPTSYTYNSMVSRFVKKGYFDEVWGILKEMGEAVCPADIATYNLIVQSLGKIGRADVAKTVLDILVSQGGHLDIVMYNTLIDALGKDDKIDEAVRLFCQMKESGIHPDIVTFNILIRAHVNGGRLEDALVYSRMMLEARCAPNHVTDTILELLEKEITKFRRQNEPKRSFKL